MEWVETTGKTLQDAKDAALDKLGVDEHDAEFEVIEQPRAGLFGRMRAEARVRARVRPTAPRAKEDRRDRRRRDRGPAKAESPTDTDGARAEPPAGGADAGAGLSPRQRTTSRETSSRSEKGGPEVEVDLDDQARVAQEFLEGLLRELGLSAGMSLSRPDEDTVDIDLSGDGLGMLIGPKGSTLLALQDLARTVVRRENGAMNGRIQVDVSGYRQKRAEALARFAERVAGEAAATGTRVPLEPMTAADRRIVHDALSKVEGVTTVSEGEESRRHVVVIPAGQ
ncbi:MAG: RNA-binding cell elongation regulator Jag/EloR [Acidimicrobiales bacterium]